MPNNPKKIAETFYIAFGRLDSQTMSSLYHPEATFYDPAFGDLNSEETKTMWKALCRNAEDFSISFQIVEARNGHVSTKWTAKYTYPKTGRKVINHVLSEMKIKDQLIIRQIDTFSLWNWAKQAFGPLGWLIGWSPYFKSKMRQSTKKILQKFGE